MDAIDRKILLTLQEDASLSVAEIGQRVGRLTDRIETAVHAHLDDLSSSEARVVAARRRLYEISVANVNELRTLWHLC